MARELRDEIAGVLRDAPWTQAEQIYSARLRQIIARLIPDFLADHKVTVIELLHRPDMMIKLEGTGTLLQYVVQQIAIAQASLDKTPIQQVIRQLNDVMSDVYEKVREARHGNVFPEAAPEKFGKLAAKLAAKPDGLYRLNGALARHLRDAQNWNDKAVRLLILSEGAEGLLAKAIDALLAEILATPAAMLDIIGPKPNFGEMLAALINLFLGIEQAGQYGDGQALALLARRFSAGALPVTHAALAARIVADFYGLQRLRADSTDNELRMLQQLTELALQGVGDVLRREALLPALAHRSSRFVTAENLKTRLAATVLPDEKLDWLFFADGCISGENNKLRLAEAALRVVTAESFKNQFCWTQVPLLKRLQRLASLQAKALACDLFEGQKAKLAGLLDAIACKAAVHEKLFETIDGKQASPVRKALAVMHLFGIGAFTEGRLSTRARDLVMGYMAEPGFLTEYAGISTDAEAATAELSARLQKIGITPQRLTA